MSGPHGVALRAAAAQQAGATRLLRGAAGGAARPWSRPAAPRVVGVARRAARFGVAARTSPVRRVAHAARGGSDEAEPVPPLTAQKRKPSAPAKPKAQHPGKYGEKTADGSPKPDERTVADLLRRGWFATAEQAEAVLTRYETRVRYPFETAGPAADWLEARFATLPAEERQCAAVRALSKFPHMLGLSVEVLQRGWDTLVRPQADGGLGYTPERAARRVSSYPRLLSYTPEHLLDTAAVLEECGVAVGTKAIAKQPTLLCLAATTLLEHAAWWKQTGLDYSKILTAHPSLLVRSSDSSNKHLQDKLDFLLDVVGMSYDELNKAGVLLGLSLEKRLRPGYFYARLKGTVHRWSTSTLMLEADPSYVAYALGRGNGRNMPASTYEVKRYKLLVESPSFAAWSARQEAHIYAKRASSAVD